jgi:hypothetical protein
MRSFILVLQPRRWTRTGFCGSTRLWFGHISPFMRRFPGPESEVRDATSWAAVAVKSIELAVH